MSHRLVHLALKEHRGDCEPNESLRGQLAPGLDIDTCTFQRLDDRHVAVDIEYSLVLVRQPDEEIVCDLSATWRLVYEVDGVPENPREFAAQHGVTDAWLVWKTWLEATMSWMGLTSLRVAPVAPEGLVSLALEAFDME